MNTSGGHSDEVDEIVAAWKRERQDLDSSPLEIFSRLLRLNRHLDKFRRQAFAAHGLDVWEFEMLSLLRRQGEPYQAQPSQFMSELLVASGTLTHRINTMVERGHAIRHQDSRDRRIKYVRATPLGITKSDRAMEDLLRSEAAMVQHISAEDQHTMSRILRDMLVPFSGETA
ncbi:MarR family winged helix-turn-helix transcriptional regulator [Flaviflexus equikiangi]|uniref:Winged helix-turn-helix transcriptional regulator n=1 Tax=Flaviflexus equikiangi TaxID=2758573 RepID=A0ABS2TD43_9ACTO|nr:MarR family winged helix-turn-helix transcriptional regulator [Flaviflexus equikiangi]MBM9432580.1 winged helix-turn-helix transcriptional regulator [Flaviflexus equikiangi]